jgi:hypothetical protein
MISSSVRGPLEAVALAAMLPVRLVTALSHRLIDHPFEIDRLDASAEALWPSTPEEPQPPRWRLEGAERPREGLPQAPSPKVVATGRRSAVPSCR